MRADEGTRNETSDAELVEGVRRGDSRAFEFLVRRHLPRAHSLAASVLSDDDQADDICQDAFLAALRRIDHLRDPERFRGWLLRIVKNMALNHLKRESRAAAISLEALDRFPGTEDPAEDLRREEIRGALAKGLEQLTGLPKRVFVLHEIEGWDHEEIAQELGISRGASRVHLFLARRTLRVRVFGPSLEEGL